MGFRYNQLLQGALRRLELQAPVFQHRDQCIARRAVPMGLRIVGAFHAGLVEDWSFERFRELSREVDHGFSKLGPNAQTAFWHREGMPEEVLYRSIFGL